jgi:ATP-dependent DNA helicase RecG
MRPHILSPLFAGVRSLEGVGPRLEAALQRLLQPIDEASGPRVIDLLFHLPTGLIDRRARPTIADAKPGQFATLDVSVLRHAAPPRGKRRLPYRIFCEDGSGEIELVFFHSDQAYLKNLLPVGERRFVSGRLEVYDGRLQMPHPDYVVTADEMEQLPLIEPVYPLTEGLSRKVLLKAEDQALARLPELTEWQDGPWIKTKGWAEFSASLRRAHAPQSEADLLPEAPARQRLAYDELLANQLALALIRKKIRRAKGRPVEAAGALRETLLGGLPFELTGSQRQALGEIDADMAASHRMLRLLQGDVGSGKTVVALLAMASCVEAGYQAALMAPTEVLARQHLQTISSLAGESGLRIGLLTGRERGRERDTTLERLEAGEIDILIGTHALIQHPVAFKDLALAVIDEQHRFGVHQRIALQSKGGDRGTDVLVMTATPIPRTLVLTNYGDMDASQLTEKPAGRKPVITRALPIERIGEVTTRLEDALAAGAQAYWVCPLVEESDLLDISAAEERYAELASRFGDRVGLVHGRLSGSEKDAVMAAFGAGDLSILVATTVIEVGVDVPNATIMVIEHSERFGLAQLHQLRGRVGRGEDQSSCILLYQPPLSEAARARLKILRETEDGFRIADEDLRLRGGGEVLGTRQSGLPSLRIARLPEDRDLLDAANDDAKLVLAQDSELTSARGKALRILLYLFARDEAVRLLRAG